MDTEVTEIMKYATWDLELEILSNNWNTFQFSEVFYLLKLALSSDFFN